jgi:glycerophosphoryl diester phosphodiesterase
MPNTPPIVDGSSLKDKSMSTFFAGQKPRLFAHRGASGETPENTLVAFQRAVELGMTYAELDVHASRDGVVVVCHDATLERTTNGHGHIREFSLTELQRLDAGYHFSTDGGETFPFRGAEVKIPALVEVLENFPTLHLTIEIKQIDPPIEKLVVSAVRSCGREEQVILASEHDVVLARVRALAPEIATSSSYGEVLEFIQRVEANRLSAYRPPGQALQIPPEFQGTQLVTAQTVVAAHALNCEMHVWTIDDHDEMERLLDLGVDGIMSNFPDRLLEVVRRR